MSPSEAFPFDVRVQADSPGMVSSDAAITVLDGHDEVRASGHGVVEAQLPAGVYAVQVERAGVRSEQVVRHAAATDLVIGSPMRFSSVPTSDTATSHEYYQGPATQWCEAPTAPPLVIGREPDGSLFIFLRAPSAGATTGSPDPSGLRLLDYAGTELVPLDDATTQRDDGAGWLAFHAAAPSGGYVLRYVSPDEAASPSREMALEVFAGWQTQLFMTWANGPLFGSASVLMGHGFQPDDRIVQAVDAALAGLQNGTDLLPPGERQLLLYAKFDNPMLGLVGAHALFRETDVEQGAMATIIGNLQRLLGPDSPDVRALELMAAKRFGSPFDPRPFEQPPVLRAGLEAVCAATIESPDLVPRGGLVEQIATRRLRDSPWSTWRPLVGLDAAASPDWVAQFVRDAALDAIRRDEVIDVKKTAASAKLPLDSISTAYEQLRESLPRGTRRTVEMERLVAHARNEATTLGLDRDQVRDLFFAGGPGDRVRALGLMQGDASVRDLDVALEAVRSSESAFEQYHALRLGRQMIPELDVDERRQLTAAIEEQRGPGGWITRGTDRWTLSEQMLRDMRSH